MYPLHKYVRTPFGTYLMYINHGPERINVQSLPQDVTSFKKAYSKKPTQKKPGQEKCLKFLPKGSNEEAKNKSLGEVPPSYNIRFLQHNGQTVTEPPSNLILVDDITGADISSSMSWIRNRPKQWKERIEMHKIENPKMTSTLPKAPLPQPSNRSLYPAGGKLLGYRLNFDGISTKELSPPQPPETSKSHPKFPKVDKMKSKREKAQSNREAREVAAKKRRRKVDKIMCIVENRAFVAKIEAQVARDETASTSVQKDYSSYFNEMEHPQPDSQQGRLRTPSMEKPLIDRSSTALSNRELIGRETVYEKISPPKIQDWNPREDQELINQVILQRMEKAMPYRWKVNGEGYNLPVEASSSSHQPNYRYVL